ncbi:hypothetical protein CAOG_07511 [Capsaspora owczarzaki ATCC 30864]|uniref:Glutathione S-transferase n=1 Tax=Capsaspora owczarzaki (strain ATCC 30864) TaxID=595528 RepID=A0A0D2WVW0_CAPO3|nr:hypothetical protein CAOG_07511 [Capsaspora owczarzaki ATCC 30864]KJE97025.1 hypothetical protein CAOG_007511 [Capsaspora owczarzaki ATCC 30864]|eukprot:XP_004343385.1 hypothetical protein CAOG_07511 [Capsaspora owczarzaki ATCC 30864]
MFAAQAFASLFSSPAKTSSPSLASDHPTGGQAAHHAKPLFFTTPHHLKLTYFPIRGLAEDIRLILEESGIAYESENISFHDWHEGGIKQQRAADNPFGQMPILYVNKGEFILSQSKAIIRFIARSTGLDGGDAYSAARCDQLAEGIADLRRQYATLAYDKEFAAKVGDFINKTLVNSFTTIERVYDQNKTRYLLSQDRVSYADIMLFELVDQILALGQDARSVVAKFDRIGEVYKSIAARPRIAAYLASSRRVVAINGASASVGAFKA